MKFTSTDVLNVLSGKETNTLKIAISSNVLNVLLVLETIEIKPISYFLSFDVLNVLDVLSISKTTGRKNRFTSTDVLNVPSGNRQAH